MSEEDIFYNTYRLSYLSDDPGVIKKKYTYSGIDYMILNSNSISRNVDEYRSVVFSSPENKLLSFSPAKSVRYEKFKDDYYDVMEEIVVNEMIEGVMINLFYDERIESWEIATKSKICGKYNKYSDLNTNKSTFRNMFFDVFRESDTKNINNITSLKLLSKKYSYSFVMRHPDMSGFIPLFSYPQIFLVAVYQIYSSIVEYISPNEYENWEIFKNVNNIIQFPRKYENFRQYNDIFDNCNGIYNISKNIKGIMITNTLSGERTKIISDSYRNNKEIIPANLQYQYFCLNRIFFLSKTSDKNWIKTCPLFKKQFLQMNENMEEFIKKIYESYLSFYVFKNNMEISEKYYSHIYKIHHGIYLPSLKKKPCERIKITRNIIKNYFYNMEPRELFFIYNLETK